MKKNTVPYLVGLTSGFANGLFGSGGGAIAVSAMERYMGMKAHEAHADAVAVILPLCLVSMFFYLGKSEIDFNSVIWVSLGGAIGGFAGAKLLKKLSPKWLKKLFGICMMTAAIKMIF